jgi:signal transduction histidine kinase
LDALRQRLPGAQRPASLDPSSALFRRIRLRLILWYASVLAVVLLAAGGLLYFAMERTVMGPVNDVLTAAASDAAEFWQESDTSPCLSSHYHFIANVSVVCYDSTGKTVIGTAGVGTAGVASQAPGFLNPSLAKRALRDSTASDIVDSGVVGGYDLGAVSRYAIAVRDPDTNQVIGVLQVGALVGGQTDALHALLRLLLILGPLSLGVATVGGFFLAERALAPARLAFTRQQAFIADASHELRTPLALLRADAEVLLRGRERLTVDDAALLEDIVGETEHLTGIANNLLTLARLDSGGVRLERDVVDLAAIAGDAARRIDALAREQGITVRMGTLTSVAVIGDAQLLAQATMALLDNAIKYAGAGSEVTLTTSRDGGNGTLTVHDNGPGIAAEHLPLLGQRFYRPDKARSRAAGGAGLGLSVVRGILALHHGSLDLESAPGAGTSATLRLPAIPHVSHPADDTSAATMADARDEAGRRA